MINIEIFISSLILTLVLTVILTRKIIPVLAKKKIGQKILDIGPNWHKRKEGTPTMGGIAFLVSSLISTLLTLIVFNAKFEKREILLIINVFSYALLNCLVGIIDDVAKIKKSKNEGLTPKGKLAFQGILAVIFLVSLKLTVGLTTVIAIPFTNFQIDFGFFYYVLSFLLLCGTVNAVNLTDGIDGLASTCVLTVGVFLSFAGVLKSDSNALIFFGAVLIGSTLGFLAFNLHPAKIFMGDTGSLFLGSIVVGTAFIIGNPLLVVIYGFVFMLEAASDILQVLYFKLTKGKRLFKMAPLHHHLEKSGYSEMKIVAIFGLINTIFCIVAFLGMEYI